MLRTPTISRPTSIDDLLDGRLASRITQLDLASKKIFAGKMKGERRSKKRGESVEFADHRPYVSGDDLRHIDWNIFGRLDRLFLKLFLEEEDLSLHVVIDASASSDCGEPNKFLFMQKAAMALSYLGLANYNRVAATAIGGTGPNLSEGARRAEGGVVSTIRDLRGKRRSLEMGGWLCDLTPDGATSFGEAAKRISLTRRGKGVMIVLSDFFMKEGYETGLRLLVGRGYDVFAIQVLSPQEVDPSIAGDLRLKDVEDGDMAEVTISAPLIKKYKQNLAAYCDQFRLFCARREITALTVQSDLSVESLILDYLQTRGLLMRTRFAMVLCVLSVGAAGCHTNRTPFHSEMTRTEMREAVEERFPIGMTWSEVVTGLDDVNMKWHRTSQCWDAPHSKGMVMMVMPPGTYWNAMYRTGALTFVFDDQSALWDAYYNSYDGTGASQKRLYLERVKP